MSIGGCFQQTTAELQATGPRTVEVIEVGESSAPDRVQLIGRIEPGEEVTLYFEVPGVVAEMLVEEGDDVAPGDPIARLEQDDYRLAVLRAKAELEAAVAQWELLKAGTRKEDIALARAEYERAKGRHAFWNGEYDRVKKNVESRAVSESEFQRVWQERDAAIQEESMSKAGLERAVAGFRKEEIAAAAANVQALMQATDLAQRQLDKATLTVPFAGRIERRLVDPGAFINVFPMGGVPVVQLVNLEQVDAVVAVPEALLSRFSAGQQVTVVSAVNERVRGSGRLMHVGQVADPSSGTYQVRVRIPNPDGRLTGGMVVLAEAPEETDRRSIRVPLTAVRRAFGQPPYVLLVKPDENKVVQREVELGPIAGNEVEVINGLLGGELLIVRGQHLIVAGDQVRHEAFNKVPIARKTESQP
jgi:multidrug efflux pump subunit AcrA (membrane-fusion protein)